MNSRLRTGRMFWLLAEVAGQEQNRLLWACRKFDRSSCQAVTSMRCCRALNFKVLLSNLGALSFRPAAMDVTAHSHVTSTPSRVDATKARSGAPLADDCVLQPPCVLQLAPWQDHTASTTKLVIFILFWGGLDWGRCFLETPVSGFIILLNLQQWWW